MTPTSEPESPTMGLSNISPYTEKRMMKNLADNASNVLPILSPSLSHSTATSTSSSPRSSNSNNYEQEHNVTFSKVNDFDHSHGGSIIINKRAYGAVTRNHFHGPTVRTPHSLYMGLDGSNTYEAGSMLKGTVHLFTHPSVSHDEDSGKSHLNIIGCEGNLSIVLEGFEQTWVVLRRGRSGSVTFTDECRFLREETNYPMSLIADQDVYVVDFAIQIPQDIPSTIKYLQHAEIPRSGGCAIPYFIKAKWVPAEHHVHHEKRVSAFKPVEIKGLCHKDKNRSISVGISSPVEVPNLLCGLIELSTTQTFSLMIWPALDRLNLTPGQELEIKVGDEDAKAALHLFGSIGSYKMMIKLTQKPTWCARRSFQEPMEMPEQIQSWKLPVTNGTSGKVTIPSKGLQMSYHGKLIQIQHELVVYVYDPLSSNVVATTPPIPVTISPPGDVYKKYNDHARAA